MSIQPDNYTWEAEHISRLDADIERLKLLLSRSKQAISEAGYEDFDEGLMSDIDEALTMFHGK